LAYQEPNYWPFRNQPFGLLGTGQAKHPSYFKALRTYPHPVTRARDLNWIFNILTPHPSPRLSGGSAPCRLKPTHPAHPHKERPPGELQNPNTAPPPFGRRENEDSGTHAG